MFVIIAGGGRTGSQLALTLLEQNHQVHLIENRKEILSRIHRELPTEIIFEGNFLSPETLIHAGIRDAQVLATVTTSDEQNLALCYYARTQYGIQRTIARVNNPRNAWLFDHKFHVDVAVNPTALMAHLIDEEISLGDMTTLLKLHRGNLSLIEKQVPEGAAATGVAIRDLGLPDHAVIAAIIRNGEVIVPRGTMAFEAGDEVLIVTDRQSAEDLAAFFDTPVKT